jgi:hypothetical protein
MKRAEGADEATLDMQSVKNKSDIKIDNSSAEISQLIDKVGEILAN